VANKNTTAGGIAVQSRPAPLQGQETMLQKRFAVVRGEIARKRQLSAALRAIKTAGRRLFQCIF